MCIRDRFAAAGGYFGSVAGAGYTAAVAAVTWGKLWAIDCIPFRLELASTMVGTVLGSSWMMSPYDCGAGAGTILALSTGIDGFAAASSATGIFSSAFVRGSSFLPESALASISAAAGFVSGVGFDSTDG